MNLEAYFQRIGFTGRARADLDTLNALHRAHADAIPFEDIDVQLRRRIDISPEAIFDKLVARRRGGWCYEQNGLMDWALREIGFDVTRVAGAVMRRPDGLFGNHLCLLVRLDDPWLVDVGFGGSLAAPMPLRAGARADAPFEVALSLLDDGWWRFEESVAGVTEGPFHFDFRAEPGDEALLARTCAHLESAPDSSFVLNLVVQQRRGGTHTTLRGRLLGATGAAEKRLIDSPGELVGVLRNTFGLDVPEAASLWDQVCARHAALFAAGAS